MRVCRRGTRRPFSAMLSVRSSHSTACVLVAAGEAGDPAALDTDLRRAGCRRRKRGQSISGRKPASARCACRMPAVSICGSRFGQRMPPPAAARGEMRPLHVAEILVVERLGQRACRDP